MYQGRLEVCANGYWGTVCNDRFDINAARIVCLQLGIQENGKLRVKTLIDNIIYLIDYSKILLHNNVHSFNRCDI